MANIFARAAMAAGYAAARPALHAPIIARVREHLQFRGQLARALDVGCGAGLSTRPLRSIARQCIGIDPAEAMLRWGRTVVPDAAFVVGSAEALPVRSSSIDIITAAGSLDYADLNLFFPEASRVLGPAGVLVVYDFSEGRRLRGSDRLDTWYSEFLKRYPPPDSSRPVTPESLRTCNSGLRLSRYEHFEMGLMLEPSFYIDYVLTETNIAHALMNGAAEEEIRAWCARTLEPVFQGQAREVLFPGYIAYIHKA